MTTSGNLYDTQEQLTPEGIQYVFMSNGTEDIIKVVEYSFVDQFSGSDIYNLGFGDYDVKADRLLDDPISNNGDQYRVFNTVLGTIPDFFSHYPKATVAVQGSDSREEYIRRCKTNCQRRCGELECRKAHRRIRIYCNYVNKHFERLSRDYSFQGAHRIFGNQIVIEPFNVGRSYDSVLISKN